MIEKDIGSDNEKTKLKSGIKMSRIPMVRRLLFVFFDETVSLESSVHMLLVVCLRLLS